MAADDNNNSRPDIVRLLSASKRSPLSPSAGAKMSATMSDALYAEPHQALIFLDFDDTLFPTTELFTHWGLPKRPDQWDGIALSEEMLRFLSDWRVALSDYLLTALALSDRCCIITNSSNGWVEACISHFAPELSDTFENLHIVYARDCLERFDLMGPNASRGAPARWIGGVPQAEEFEELLTKTKLSAMKRESRRFYSQYPGQTWKNIVSVGDAPYEHRAIQELGFRRKGPAREKLRLKAIITPSEPSISDLTYRLKLDTILCPHFVAYNDDLTLDMTTEGGHMRALGSAAALESLDVDGVIRSYLDHVSYDARQ